MAKIKRNLRIGQPILRACFAEDDKLVALIDAKTACTIRVLSASTQDTVGEFNINLPHKYPFGFLYATNAIFVYNYPARVIERYDVASKMKSNICNIDMSYIEISAMNVSEDGKFLAIGDSLGNCSIWNVSENASNGELGNLGDMISYAAFDEKGECFVFATKNGRIVMYSLANMLPKGEMRLHKTAIVKIIFNANVMISADESGQIAIWDKTKCALIRVFSLEKGVVSDMARCSGAHGALLCTSSGQLFMIDLRDHDRKPLTIDKLNDALTCVAFNDHNKTLVTATLAGNLLFFDLEGDKSVDSYYTVSEETTPQAKQKSLKVIVVDDSITMRRIIISAISESFEYATLLEASDGKEALNLLENNPETHIMFLDWNMPTLSGEEVVKKIKDAMVYPRLQVIMATTEGGQSKVVQMLKMGVAGYLVKPFRREAIVKIVQKLVDRIGNESA
ncbi:MAG: response regulator [Helicobacteraceae bacterium]|nr:response regulator [Helicobacteraceae bacterium]